MSDWFSALVKCAERGGSNEAELQAKLDAGHTVLWPVEGGCFALDRAADGACVVWLGVGDMKALVGAENAIVAWSKDQGCSAIRIEGRKGWRRMFPHWTATEFDGVTRLERAT